jgi:hypothetical protein
MNEVFASCSKEEKIYPLQKMFKARGLLFVLLSRQYFDKKVKVKYTMVGIGVIVYITNSSPLLILDQQFKMLQDEFGDF